MACTVHCKFEAASEPVVSLDMTPAAVVASHGQQPSPALETDPADGSACGAPGRLGWPWWVGRSVPAPLSWGVVPTSKTTDDACIRWNAPLGLGGDLPRDV